MDKAIEIKGLYKSYKMSNADVEILNNIDLEVENGEFSSIMGPSGSGKSTLLYLIGGLDKPTSGSIKINGIELSNLRDREQSMIRRRKIGFVFQFYNLIPNLNVEENIMLPVLLDGKRISDYKGKLDEILYAVSMSDRRHHTPRELSGGQQQRVAIARALINDPDIILADEPIGNLDSKSGTEVMDVFARINRENHKTILQVTHSNESAKYGKRIIYIRDGRICL